MTQRQPLLLAVIVALAFAAIPLAVAIASEAAGRRPHLNSIAQKDRRP